MADSGDGPLPEGWSKHWSNTWKKHYWFNGKTGKQSWEPPVAEVTPKAADPGAGSKRKAEDISSNKPKPQPSATDSTNSRAEKNAKQPAPTKPAAGGGLAAVLGSLANVAPKASAKQIEMKKKRKEAEEARRTEERAERENYIEWVKNALENFTESGDDYYEFPPADSIHRNIIKDESDMVGLVSFAHGITEEDKRVYVFQPDKAPNELEQRFLQTDVGGGTVPELMERRAKGDTFKEYNHIFDLSAAKLVSKPKVTKTVHSSEVDEDEIESRQVIDREATGQVAEIASKIKEKREAASNELKEFMED